MIRAPLVIAIAFGVIATMMLYGTSRLSHAHSRLESTESVYQQTNEHVQRIIELRAQQPKIAEQKRPDQDVIARVSAVLAESGIPSNRFGGLRPESDVVLPGHNSSKGMTYGQQSVRVDLNDITIRELGEFLVRWRATQPLWKPSRIEIIHDRGSENSARYSINLLITATYVRYEGTPS